MKITLINPINATADTHRAMKDPFGQFYQGKRRTDITKRIVECDGYIISDNFLQELHKYSED